jgi:hypothetical protein
LIADEEDGTVIGALAAPVVVGGSHGGREHPGQQGADGHVDGNRGNAGTTLGRHDGNLLRTTGDVRL